jgi:phage terminase small subunit
MSVRTPRHLGRHGAAWFHRLVETYEVEPSRMSLAILAAECLDVGARADEAVRRDGEYHKNARGELRQHPGINVSRDHKALFCKLVKQLGLLNSVEDGRGRPTDYEANHGNQGFEKTN